MPISRRGSARPDWRRGPKTRAKTQVTALCWEQAGKNAELMGVSGVRLYHDQALYKEQGGGITPWHADQYYWPLFAQWPVVRRD